MKRWDHKTLTVYAHWKRDGINIVIRNGRAYTRKPRDFTDKLSWHPSVAKMIKSGREFHCEAFLPHARASDVITAINEQDERLRVDVFTIPDMGDAQLYEVAEECETLGVSFIPYFIHHETLKGMIAGTEYEKKGWIAWEILSGARGCYIDIYKQTIDFAQNEGFVEGFVMRNHNGDEGTKWKSTQTIDLIVTGLKPGTKSNTGVIGALICSTVEGYTVANVGGLSGFDRRRDDWIGKVIEVKYDYAQSGGRLRFPALVRERPDKPEEECTVHQDEELANFWKDEDDE